MPDAHDVNDHKVRGDLLTADDWNALARLAKYEPPQSGGEELIPRILYDDVAPGNTDKNAWPCKADMTADTTATKVLVQNTFPGKFRGYGDAHTGFDATTAAKVWTTVDLAGKEQIVYGKGLAVLILGTGPSGVVDAGAGYTLSSLVSLDGGQLPGTTVDVTNYSTALPTNAANVTVVADGTGGYRTLDGPCP
jgi:hypothetical protein